MNTPIARIAVLVGSLGLWACSAENGSGTLTGTLVVPACKFEHTNDMWIPKSLSEVDKDFLTKETHWNFFVGQPLDAPGPKFPADHPQNQIKIRMQNRSGGWEAANALFFWVLDSYEVARCMRGLTASDGTPDWDQAACDRSTGQGRMLIGTQGELVTSHFVSQESCDGAGLVAEALGACDKAGSTCPQVTVCPGRGSWISFDLRGDPTAKLSPDFKFNLGDTIAAPAFHVELCDETTIKAVETNTVPIPPPAIRGTLEGSFSFVLESGVSR